MTREERHVAVLSRLLKSMYVCDSVQPTGERKKAIKAAIQTLSQEPCETCGYAEGSPFCLQYCPYDAERKKEQEPTVQDKQAESEKYQKAFDDGYANGYAQARFDYEQEPCEKCEVGNPCLYCKHKFSQKSEPCEDVVSREWLMRKATERFYTTNYFNHISAMIEEAPSVTQKSGKWVVDLQTATEDYYVCSECGRKLHLIYPDIISNYPYCHCGAKMVEPQESEDK